jgi:hypothetical protein
MYANPQQTGVLCAWLLSVHLCFCGWSHGQEPDAEPEAISQAQLEKLSRDGSTLRVLLMKHNVLPKHNKSPDKLAEEVSEMLFGKLRLQVRPSEKNMEDIDLVGLMVHKYGSLRDITLIFAACLQTCEIPTAVANHGDRWLLMFRANTNVHYKVQWNNQTFGVVALPPDGKWSRFTDATQEGEARYRQLEAANGLSVISVDSHWHWNFSDTIETLLRRGIDLAQAGIDLGQPGKLAESEGCFKNVLRIAPKNAAAQNNLGNLELFRKKYNVAIAKYQQALLQAPNDSAIFLNLGIAYYLKWKQSADEKAKPELERQSQDAFDEAYRGIRNWRNVCRYLSLNPKNESDAEYCWLIYDAEKRVTDEEPKWRPIGGRGNRLKKVPVYWKSF